MRIAQYQDLCALGPFKSDTTTLNHANGKELGRVCGSLCDPRFNSPKGKKITYQKRGKKSNMVLLSSLHMNDKILKESKPILDALY